MTRLAIFVVLSAGPAYISRGSLATPRSHGFYRFFAWECILGLFVLNFVSFSHWFGDPLTVRQIVSWMLLMGSLVPLVPSVYQLRAQGEPDDRRREGAPLLGIEKTTQLVTTGVFKLIRHPMYTSLLLLAWGVFFKKPSWEAGGLALAATGFLLATARVEERENVDYFGSAYRAYMRDTKRFIPFVY
jgi:protein-S-isoprenylcysteine O-methyltransferase Ste14